MLDYVKNLKHACLKLTCGFQLWFKSGWPAKTENQIPGVFINLPEVLPVLSSYRAKPLKIEFLLQTSTFENNNVD